MTLAIIPGKFGHSALNECPYTINHFYPNLHNSYNYLNFPLLNDIKLPNRTPATTALSIHAYNFINYIIHTASRFTQPMKKCKISYNEYKRYRKLIWIKASRTTPPSLPEIPVHIYNIYIYSGR